jgi:outer membrane biosynthesis protein TonB
MEIETKVQALEDEFKLMKGELKQALSDVRDFLVTFPTPTINEGVFERFHEMQTGTGGGGGGGQGTPPMVLPEYPRKAEDLVSADLEVPGKEEEPETQETPEETEPPENLELPEEEEEPVEPETEEAVPLRAEVDEELPPTDAMGGLSQSTTQVNILTNLIRWVSVSKREVGIEQLPTFLEVYSQQGKLSPELKLFILQLAEVIEEPNNDTSSSGFVSLLIREQLSTLLDVRSNSGQIPPELKESVMNLVGMMAEPAPKGKPADVWSRLILELHGIISHGDFSIPPLKNIQVSPVSEPPLMADKLEKPPANAAARKNKPKPQPKPMKLKLIMPVGKGQDKEFTFNLDPKKFGGSSSLSF